MSDLEARQSWTESAISCVQHGQYEAALQILANNVGNRGNVIEFIKDFCENSDPWLMK